MISTNKFLFIHLHKSGGTFINNILMKHIPESKRLGYHLPYRETPDGHSELPVLGVVRNPWDYYISFYFFQHNSRRPNYVYNVFTDNGRLSLEEYLMNISHPQDHHFDKLKECAPHKFRNNGVNLTKQCIEELRGREGGWYTRMFERLYDGANDVHFVQTENLRGDLLNAFDIFGCQVSSDCEYAIAEGTLKNTSKRDHYSCYYTDETIEAIALGDAKLIERFSYNFISDVTPFDKDSGRRRFA